MYVGFSVLVIAVHRLYAVRYMYENWYSVVWTELLVRALKEELQFL